MASMATGAEWSCPICHEASGNIACVGSCLHQFCQGCIVRWTRKNPSCPLCRQTVHTIIYPASPDQGFVEMAVPVPVAEPTVSRGVGPEEEPEAAAPQPPALVGGFPAETWAFFFSNHVEILRPLEMWLNEVLYGACWWDVAFAQGRIVASLCRHGLQEEALVRDLQPFLQDQTVAFVRQLIEVAAYRCSELARLRMDTGPQQAEAGAGAVAFPGTSGAQEERREGPGEARAGPSWAGQGGGCGPGPSGRRRGGGAQDTGANKKAFRRQN